MNNNLKQLCMTVLPVALVITVNMPNTNYQNENNDNYEDIIESLEFEYPPIL